MSLAEKMTDAGVDTVGARLTAACIEGIRMHPNNIAEAWRLAGATFGHEFVSMLMRDMQPKVPAKQPTEMAEQQYRQSINKLNRSTDRDIGTAAPYKPRVIPPERLEKRRDLQRIVRSKYRNSSDVAWSDVGWHELHALKRDGAEALALLQAGPASVPNDGRSVGDVLGVKKVDEIIGAVRK